MAPMPDLKNFQEPFRSQFIAAIHQGAAAADIHDVSTRVGYVASTGEVSEAFLKRELERPYRHAANICQWIRHLTPVGRILDVGCGTAGLSMALAWTFPDACVECFDADASSVRAANLRIAGYGLMERVKPRVVAPNTSFPYESASFDLVSCTSVLEFVTRVEDRRSLLEEIRRVVRPGGYIVLTTPNPWFPFELHSKRFLGNWHRRPGFPWASTGRWIRRQLRDCVFHPVTGRLSRKLGLKVPGFLSRYMEPCLPWQFLLAQAPGRHNPYCHNDVREGAGVPRPRP